MEHDTTAEIYKRMVEDRLIESEILMEMGNVTSRLTGIGPTIMLSSKYIEGKESKHGPRIKVSNVCGRWAPDSNFTLTLEDSPRIIGRCELSNSDLSSVHAWVAKNKEHIINVWHNGHNMDPDIVAKGIKKL